MGGRAELVVTARPYSRPINPAQHPEETESDGTGLGEGVIGTVTVPWYSAVHPAKVRQMTTKPLPRQHGNHRQGCTIFAPGYEVGPASEQP